MSLWSRNPNNGNGKKNAASKEVAHSPPRKKVRKNAYPSGGTDSWGAYEGKFDGWKVGGSQSRIRTFPNSASSSLGGGRVSSSSYGSSDGSSNGSTYNSTYNSTFVRPLSTAPSSYSQATQANKVGWINKNNTGSQKFAGAYTSNKFNAVEFEKKLKNKKLNMNKSMSSNIGLDPQTVFSSDDEFKALNQEQRLIVESVIFGGFNVFFTGPAGTGKSKVLNSILRMNQMGNRPKKVVISATTGIAACAVGGITVHSFAGVGIGSEPVEKLQKKVASNEYAKERWKKCQMLVIDEISMMEGLFLDKLDAIAKQVRGNKKPFGGIQLVMCGDFFQLPPIAKGKAKSFAFNGRCWCDLVDKSVLLTKIYRQNSDPTLVKILNEARVGELSSESWNTLKNHMNNPPVQTNQLAQPAQGPAPPPSSLVTLPVCFTKLECKNVDVDAANEKELSKLDGNCHHYKSDDNAKATHLLDTLKYCQAPSDLYLKEGAQVMLLKNLDPERELVNGSRGVVTKFVHWSEAKREDKDLTLPQGWRQDTKLPVVEFTGINSNTSVKIIVTPKRWENMDGDACKSSRAQLPLRLAWSLSVHKSQGMTISKLEVSLEGVFEYGQAYVALSRATCMNGLVIKNINRNGFIVSPDVKEFYNVLEKVAGEQEGSKRMEKENDGSCSASRATPRSKLQAPLLKPSHKALTTEQRRMIEENKARALALRKRRKDP